MQSYHFLYPYLTELERSLDVLSGDLKQELGLQAPALQLLQFDTFSKAQLDVAMLRLDSIHPIVSGNKWYKLKYNLAQALQQNAQTLVTFGGAWSNHLHAFSYIGKTLGLKTVAVIRGQEWQQQNTPLLEDIRAWGTQVVAVSRNDYQKRNNPDYQQAIQARFQNSYLIPEGGDNYFGILGMASLFADLAKQQADAVAAAGTVALACGTANSLLGIRLALPARQQTIGISALKGNWYPAMVANKLTSLWPLYRGNWQVFTRFHGGGFGKMSPAIQRLAKSFEAQTQIQLDPVYTAKLLYGIAVLAEEGFFPKGHRLLLIHTGGLQGRRSLLLNS